MTLRWPIFLALYSLQQKAALNVEGFPQVEYAFLSWTSHACTRNETLSAGSYIIFMRGGTCRWWWIILCLFPVILFLLVGKPSPIGLSLVGGSGEQQD